MKIFITGGSGFIGSNLAKFFCEKGNEVIIYDHNPPVYLKNLNGLCYINGDILDFDKLVSSSLGVDVLIHLAAKGSVIDSIKNPLESMKVNLNGTLNALEAVKINNIPQMFFSSTAGAFMGNTNPPVNEQSIPSPISNYGASKGSAELYISSYRHLYNLNIIILRFSNVFGRFSLHKNGIITNLIKNNINNIESEIYGNGESTRDYLHVDDICNIIDILIKKSFKTSNLFNLGTNIPTSILTLVDLIENISNKKMKLKYKNARNGEVSFNYVNNKKIVSTTGYKFSKDLEKNLKDLYMWFKENI